MSGEVNLNYVLHNPSAWVNKVYCYGGAKCRVCAAVFFLCGNFVNCSSPGFVLQEGDLAEAEYVEMPLSGMMFDKL